MFRKLQLVSKLLAVFALFATACGDPLVLAETWVRGGATRWAGEGEIRVGVCAAAPTGRLSPCYEIDTGRVMARLDDGAWTALRPDDVDANGGNLEASFVDPDTEQVEVTVEFQGVFEEQPLLRDSITLGPAYVLEPVSGPRSRSEVIVVRWRDGRVLPERDIGPGVFDYTTGDCLSYPTMRAWTALDDGTGIAMEPGALDDVLLPGTDECELRVQAVVNSWIPSDDDGAWGGFLTGGSSSTVVVQTAP